MTPVLKTNRRLLLRNIVRYTFPNKAVEKQAICDIKYLSL